MDTDDAPDVAESVGTADIIADAVDTPDTGHAVDTVDSTGTSDTPDAVDTVYSADTVDRADTVDAAHALDTDGHFLGVVKKWGSLRSDNFLGSV